VFDPSDDIGRVRHDVWRDDVCAWSLALECAALAVGTSALMSLVAPRAWRLLPTPDVVCCRSRLFRRFRSSVAFCSVVRASGPPWIPLHALEAPSNLPVLGASPFANVATYLPLLATSVPAVNFIVNRTRGRL